MNQTPETIYLISFSMIVVMKIICFILGYKTIKLGYNLISAGVKGEFKFSSSFAGFKADLASVSPGLLFVALGIMLITIAIYINKTVSYYNTKSNTTITKDSTATSKTTTPVVPMKKVDSNELKSVFH
ncbi:MAG: hypothetical protein JWR61_1310 [Ferruginibacter sp.]|nr:hypothetical protein [Ferruginibacter sp.]